MSEAVDGLALRYGVRYDSYSSEIVDFNSTRVEDLLALFVTPGTAQTSTDAVAAEGNDDMGDVAGVAAPPPNGFPKSIDVGAAKTFVNVHTANSDASVHFLARIDGAVSAPVAVMYSDKRGGAAAFK